jgi:hypothetical protein
MGVPRSNISIIFRSGYEFDSGNPTVSGIILWVTLDREGGEHVGIRVYECVI